MHFQSLPVLADVSVVVANSTVSFMFKSEIWGFIDSITEAKDMQESMHYIK